MLKIKNEDARPFLSTPDNLHSNGTREPGRSVAGNGNMTLDVTRTELAYSMQDISTSTAMFNEIDDEIRNDSANGGKATKAGFNWRLVYHPKCITLGLAIFLHSCGMSLVYYAIPPLGKSSGMSLNRLHLLL